MITKPENLSERDYISSRELAQILGMHVDSIYRWSSRGYAPFEVIKIGGRTYFSGKSVNRVLK